MQRNKLVIALALTTAVSASIMMISVAWRAGYADGFVKGASAKQPQGQTPAEVKTIVGKISGITGTTVTIQTYITGSAKPVTYQIGTNSSTTFERMIQKDQKTYQAEQVTFSAKLKTARANGTVTPLGPIPPAPFTLQKSSLINLRIGDVILTIMPRNTPASETPVATRILFETFPQTASSSPLQ